MRTFLSVVSLSLLSLGTPQAQAPTPAQLVDRATAMAKACGYTLKPGEQIGNKVESTQPTVKENSMASRVSLPMLLRTGRYTFHPPDESARHNGREARVIRFNPAKWGQPGVQPGENDSINRAINKVMNNLAGQIVMDKATGELAHLDAKLVRGQLFLDWFVYINSIDITIDQKLVGSNWLPDRVHLDLKGYLLFGAPIRYVYDATFACVASK